MEAKVEDEEKNEVKQVEVIKYVPSKKRKSEPTGLVRESPWTGHQMPTH